MRAIDVDAWTTLGWRSIFGAATLGLVACVRYRLRWRAMLVAIGGVGLAAGLLSCVAMMSYLFALKLTTVANVLAIYATAPFVAVGISRLWLGERPTRAVLVACAVAFVGVLGVVGFAGGAQDLAGDGFAFVMTVTFSLLLVMARRYPKLDLVLVNAVGAAISTLICMPFMSHSLPAPGTLGLLAAFGVATMALAYLLCLTGSRFITAGEAGLISQLDLVMGPVWVWWLYGERASQATLIGGGLILTAVVGSLIVGRSGAAPMG